MSITTLIIIAVIVIAALPVIFKIIIAIYAAFLKLRRKHEQWDFQRRCEWGNKEMEKWHENFIREEMAKEQSTWFTAKNTNDSQNVNIRPEQQINANNEKIPYLPPVK